MSVPSIGATGKPVYTPSNIPARCDTTPVACVCPDILPATVTATIRGAVQEICEGPGDCGCCQNCEVIDGIYTADLDTSGFFPCYWELANQLLPGLNCKTNQVSGCNAVITDISVSVNLKCVSDPPSQPPPHDWEYSLGVQVTDDVSGTVSEIMDVLFEKRIIRNDPIGPVSFTPADIVGPRSDYCNSNSMFADLVFS